MWIRDVFWPLMQHLRRKKRTRSTPPTPQFFEPLEERLLLSTTVPGLHGTYEVGAELIKPIWFQEIEGPPESSGQSAYDNSSGAVGVQSVVGEVEGQTVDVRPNEWIVQLNSDAIGGITQIEQAIGLFPGSIPGFRVVRGLGMEGQLLAYVPGDQDQAVTWLAGNPNVAYYHPNHVSALGAVPNDYAFSELWGMNNTGQTGGTSDADIDAPEAWDVITGSDEIVVGIIDTGIDYTHPDLVGNMWTNPGETPDNGLDDDGNGFIDDYYGYDFYDRDSDPLDEHLHGTHVAGTIGAVGNNAVGVAGVNWSTKLMALKIFGPMGGAPHDAITGAINYTTMMRNNYGVNVCVTNNSYGGSGYDQVLYDAISANEQAGILFVAAAGNDNSNNDLTAQYPCGYDLANVISVAASDHNDDRVSFSNYGRSTVDLAAPGEDIYSTFPTYPTFGIIIGGYNTSYETISGTSMACPHVVGVAALVWSLAPSEGYARIRDAIFAGVDRVSDWFTLVSTGGRLNAYGALREYTNNEIRGSIWNDQNQNGVREQGEGGVEGITVFLDVNGNGSLDSGEKSTTSGADGSYIFNILRPDSYDVRVSPPQAWLMTSPTPAVYTVSINIGQSILGVDFGGYDARPTAVDQSLSITTGNSSNPPPVDITLGATDDGTAQGDLVFQVSTYPQHGTLVLNGNVATYTSDVGYEDEQDSFQFVVIDDGNPSASGTNVGTSTPATVTITVFPINDVPVALVASGTADEEQGVDISLSATDEETDPGDMSYSVSTLPSHGTVTLTDSVVTYTPHLDFNGTDTFQYTVTDTGDPAGSHANPGDKISDPAIVTVTINPINDRPTAVDQSVSADEDTSLGIVLNGSDVETLAGDLFFTLTLAPQHGTVTFNGNQGTYIPDSNYNGTDSFRYIVTDTGDPAGVGTSAAMSSSPATVDITVNPVNDKPVAQDQVVTTKEDQSITVTLGATDTETAGGDLVYAIVTQPGYGTLTQLSGTEYRYTPNIGYSGLDTLRFRVTDNGEPAGSGSNPGNLNSAPATVTLAVARAETFQQGDRITVQTATGGSAIVMLAGPGIATIYDLSHLGSALLNQQNIPSIPEIRLTGTTERSLLLFRSRDSITVGNITVVGASLGRIYGQTVNLTGNVDVSGGTLSYLLLNNISGGAQSIQIGAPTSSRSCAIMVFNQVSNLSIDSDTPIRMLVATNWTDTDAIPDVIETPRFDRLVVRGSRRGGPAGDFSADLIITGSGGARYAMAVAYIVGSLTDCTWDINGNVGTVLGLGQVSNWTLNIHSDLRVLRLGEVLSADVTVDGDLYVVQSSRWLAGSLHADVVRAIVIHGVRRGASGDFGADVTLDGGGRYTLAKGYVAGDITGGTWNITGNVGGVFVRGQVSNWTLNANSSVSWLRLGDVVSADVTVGDDLVLVLATRWVNGSLTADSIRKLVITGNRRTGVAGDLGADVILTGSTSALPTLIYGCVLGTLSGTTSVQGSAGVVIVGQLRGTLGITGDARLVRVSDPLGAAAPLGGEIGRVQIGGTARIYASTGLVTLSADSLYTRGSNSYLLEELRKYDTTGAWWDYQVTCSGTPGNRFTTGRGTVSAGIGTEIVATPTGDGTITETWSTETTGRALRNYEIGWGGTNYMALNLDAPIVAAPLSVQLAKPYSASERFTGTWSGPYLGMTTTGTCTGTMRVDVRLDEQVQKTVPAGTYVTAKGKTTITVNGYAEFRDDDNNHHHGPFTLISTQTWWGAPSVGIVTGETRVTIRLNATGGITCNYNITSRVDMTDNG